MTDENKVRIIVNGESAEYEHWTDVSITSELNTLARSFQVGTTAKLPQSSTLLRSFKLGDEIQIYIGDDLVLTGYVDALPISYNATSVAAAIAGRSRTEDLVDCSPAWNGYDFSNTVNSTKWSATRSPGDFVDPAITKAAIQFINVPLKQAVAQLIAPYGIHLICELNDAVVNGKINYTVRDDAPILKALQNLVASTGLYFIDDEYGNLKIVDQKKRERCTGALNLGENVLSASAQFDGSKLFKFYWLNCSQKGSNTKSGKALQSLAKSEDPDIKRFRFQRKTDQKQNGPQLYTEAEYQRAQYFKTTYEVVGWRQQGDTGELWKANTLVKIEDDILNNSQEMLITKVNYTLSESGMLTTMECVPVAGFKPNDEGEDQKNETTASGGKKLTKSSTSSWSSLNLVGPGK